MLEKIWNKLLSRPLGKEAQEKNQGRFEWSVRQSVILNEDCDDQQVFDFAISWLTALAESRWQDAVTMQIPHNCQWSPRVLEAVVTGRGFLPMPKERNPRVSKPTMPIPSSADFYRDSLRHDPEEQRGAVHPTMPIAVCWDIEEIKPDFLGSLYTSIPLDGDWSDLSADFDIRRIAPELVGFHLHRLDVA